MEAARAQKEMSKADAAAPEAKEQRANDIAETMPKELESIMEQDVADEPNPTSPKKKA